MIRKLLKYGSVLVLSLVLIVAAFLAHTWYFKPINVNLFFARTALQFALESPQLLSSIRVFEKFGISGHNAHLDDASMAAGARTFAMVRKANETLTSYDPADLGEADRLSRQIALSLLGIAVEGEKYRFHNYPVNQLFGVQNSFPSFMESTHQVHSVADAQDYVSRLAQVGRVFDQVLEGLRHREQLGIFPPRFVLDKVLEEMRNFVATPPEEGILMLALLDKMKEAKLAAGEQQRLANEARVQIEQTVYPAYGRLIDYFAALDAKVEGNYGVWHLPDGDNYYRLALRFFTTTDYSPDYIHDFGLSEVDRLQAEMLAIFDAEGWNTTAGFSAVMNDFTNDPQFYYSDTDEGREQILADYQAIIDEINAGLGAWFDVMPKATVDVRRIPQFKEKTAPGAYYNGPAMDGSRPGVFYANLYDIKATPRYGMRTLAYHEAVPGHHFQIAIAQELDDLPFFRRLIPFTAYAEGWALYSERVAWEAGFQTDPYDNLGRLQAELFRAVRLVVDTGIHARRWERERAIAYMIDNTAMAESDVVAEIERYFVMPGQACAYKVGMTKILELRDLAQAELGEAFDIREFHNVVLTNGSVPLTILEQLVRQWIDRRQSAAA